MTTDASGKALEQAVGYDFRDGTLLERSLTHRSYANESSGRSNTVGFDNERLEFLGDAVLELVLTHALMSNFSEDTEGGLSKKRASLVNEDVLARLALDLRLDAVLKVGRGEAKSVETSMF